MYIVLEIVAYALTTQARTYRAVNPSRSEEGKAFQATLKRQGRLSALNGFNTRSVRLFYLNDR